MAGRSRVAPVVRPGKIRPARAAPIPRNYSLKLTQPSAPQQGDDFEAELLEYGGEDDHAHLLVAYPSKVSISGLVNSLKGATARRVRRLDRADVRQKLWGAAFWSPSYCAVAAGGASLETVRRYIEQQRSAAPLEA